MKREGHARVRRFPRLGKDHLGSALLVAMGLGVLMLGLDYQFGTLTHMGAGFLPAVVGVLMIAAGVAIGVTAAPDTSASSRRHLSQAGGPEWRGWSCILGGVLAFVVLGRHGGLVPASFASVFIAALGDRDNTWKSAAALAAVVTLFGVAVFFYGLHLQLPLFQWG